MSKIKTLLEKRASFSYLFALSIVVVEGQEPVAGLEVVVHSPSDGRLKKETLNKVDNHFCSHSLRNIFEVFRLLVVSKVCSSKAQCNDKHIHEIWHNLT